MKLKDKVIIITGGSGLLGAAMVKHIKQNGGICLNFDVNCETNLEEGTVYCDVTNETSVREAVQFVIQSYGRIDGLVNNAYPRTSDWGIDFMKEPMDSWNENLRLQLSSHVIIIKAVAKYMIEVKNGSIVNMSSIYGVVGNDLSLYEGLAINSVAGYSAIKGGLVNLSRYLASYYGKDNIRVNCVSPGGIFDHQDETFVKRYNEKVPLGRMGNPEDIAPSVTFLLSDEARYITGHNLIVDGGWTAI